MDGEKGVGKDAARAYKMAQLAEKTDTVWGYKAIARCYKDGIGVEKDAAKAKEYVEKALGKCKNGKCNHDDLKKMLKELEGAE
jgi:TPR repeat protein